MGDNDSQTGYMATSSSLSLTNLARSLSVDSRNGNSKDNAVVDGDSLRLAMRNLPTPVVVITVEAGGEPRGATIGSFTSVCLEPALISFNVLHSSRLHRALLSSDRFAVHVLTDRQVALAEHFSVPDLESADQFASIEHVRSEIGRPPMLSSVLETLVCGTERVVPSGDHSIIVGAVRERIEGTAGAPLVYFNQSYRRIGDQV